MDASEVAEVVAFIGPTGRAFTGAPVTMDHSWTGSVAAAARDRDRAPHLQASQTPVEARSPAQLAKRLYGLGSTPVEVGLAIKLSVHSSEAQILATLG